MRTVFDRETEGTSQEQIRMQIWRSPGEELSLELPEGFVEMEDGRREGSYPLPDRPEIILEHATEKALLTLQFFDKLMKAEETEKAIQQVRKITEESFVQYTCSPVHLTEGEEIRSGWFLMKMEALEREHIKAVFSLKGRMTLLTLTYPQADQAKWHVLRDLILRSIREGKSSEADVQRGF